MTIPFPTKAYTISPETGCFLPSLGAWVSVKATSEQTAGAFNLFEVTCPVGFATPLHIHYAEQVALYVLDGSLRVYSGSSEQDAPPGSWFFQPQGTAHGLRVTGGRPARLLCVTAPAGFDGFVAQLAGAEYECGTTAARHKIEILGPLPE